VTAAKNGISTALHAIGSVFSAVWSGIVTVAKVAFTVIGTVVLTPLVLMFHAVGAVATWLWHSAFEPAWNGISAAASFVWTTVLQPVFSLIGLGLQAVGTAVSTVWRGVIEPVWTGLQMAVGAGWDWISAKFSTAWTFIKTVVIDAWNREIRGWGVVFNWLYSNVISPVWGGISTVLSAGWDWVNVHVFQPFKSGVHAIGTAFESTATWIRASWNKVKDAAATPVHWVVDNVYTNGIRSVWNGIASHIGLDLRLPAAPKFAGGGVLGGYAPGQDTVHALLSPGEAVLVPELVQMIGPGAILAANAAASGRPAGSGGARFAGGGIVGGISSAWDSVKSVASSLWRVLSDPIQAVKDYLVTPVRNALGGIGGGDWGTMIAQLPIKVVNQLVSKVTDWMKTMGGQSGLVGAAMRAVTMGVPYVWGGSSVPPGLDCSGLVYWAAQQLGLGWPRLTAAGYQSASRPVTAGGPGSLLFWGNPAYHVAINAGNGMMVEEPHPGASARFVKIWGNPTAGVYGGGSSNKTYDALLSGALALSGGSVTAATQNRLFSAQYDQGGIIHPGITGVINASGKPEAVLTNEQLGQLKRIADGGNEVPQVLIQQEQHFTASDPYVTGTVIARELRRELGEKGVVLP
jgi:hypothetical protein